MRDETSSGRLWNAWFVRVRTLALLAGLVIAGACTDNPRSDDADSPSGTASDVFPSSPPDGPGPEIGPAPADYRPTAAGAPSTDIWLGTLVREEGLLQVRDLVNVTDRDGYDNQPSFDGSGFYYVSGVDATQTEVFRYDSASGTKKQVTRTPSASEFSPQTIPGQDAFSVIHELRGRQHLWRYAFDGKELGAIFSTVEPVGYHAWASERLAVMFILGDSETPATLQTGDAISGEIRTVAENPGRSIHRIPDSNSISFVRKVSSEEWWIERLDPLTGRTERLIRTLAGREDYAWTPQGEIIMGDGSILHRWTGEGRWVELQSLAQLGLKGITRLAVSPDGEEIAIVADRAAATQ